MTFQIFRTVLEADKDGGEEETVEKKGQVRWEDFERVRFLHSPLLALEV